MQPYRRILLTHIYFPPANKPYGLMLRHIAERLSEHGHQVAVFAASDPADITGNEAVASDLAKSGIEISRVPIRSRSGMAGKLASALAYVWALVRHIVRSRPDVVTVASFPPLFAAFAVAIAGKIAGSKVLYHVQDIHPEITAPKLPSVLRPLYRLVGALMNAVTLRLVAGVVTLSPDMREILVSRGAPEARTIALNNLSLSSLGPQTEQAVDASGQRDRAFEIVYAGNMGAFQALDEVASFVRAAAVVEGVRFTFVGEGSRREWLRSQLADLCDNDRVRFLPFMPFAELQPKLARASMGLVSLDAISTRYAYPSKIPTYLAMGLPLLCVFDRSSGLAREVEGHGLGLVVDQSSMEEGVAALARIACDSSLEGEMRAHVSAYFSSVMSPEHYISRLNSLIRSL